MLSLVSLGVPDYVFVLPLLTIHVATHQFFLAGLGVIHILRLQSFRREGQTLGSAVEQGSDTRDFGAMGTWKFQNVFVGC